MRLSGLMVSCRKIVQKFGSVFKSTPGNLSTAPGIPNTGDLQVNSRAAQDASISVAIPVKNAGDEFRLLLSSMKAQRAFKKLEIVIVDSGSSDRSVETAEEFGAKVIKILPHEFSHSYARNLAAEHATGDYLLFTVQDALPPSDTWLYELFTALKRNDVVAVSCAELPREDADLFYRALSWNHYRFLEVDKQDRILCKPDQEDHLTLRKNAQLSNVACLISRDVFMRYRFRHNYAEDLDLGMRLVKDGHRLALLSSTRILHSHNRTPYYHLKRGYVDTFFISEILPGHQAAAIESERILRDVRFTFSVVDWIVCEELAELSLPCSVERLSDFVMEKLDAAPHGGYRRLDELSSDGYVDGDFKSFVKNVCPDSSFERDKGLPYDGILLRAMQNFMMMIFAYMHSTYGRIDATVLEHFKTCLYRACAFQFGCHIAACFLQASERDTPQFRKLHTELAKGV